MSDSDSQSKRPITYKDAGVDIEAGERMVDSIKEVVRDTHNDSVLRDIGGFGGLFRADFSGLDDPVLVSSVDGVGTKLIVAFKSGIYHTVGQDLVNHCVNDIAVCGAEPLFFLDYFSTGKLEENVGYEVVRGFAKACKENGVALVGGETAEMPDIYGEGEFDLAGTIVGVVERSRVITGEHTRPGDLLLGFRSTGLHTNGYSLARKVLFREYGVEDYVEELDATVGEALLAVHKSYLPHIRKLKELEGLRGFAHITGGGIAGNTRRVLPEGRTAEVEWKSWERPPLFRLIQRLGKVPEEDMRATFNLGIGLVAVVDPDAKEEVQDAAATFEEQIIQIGTVS